MGIFIACLTQWRYSYGGITGLDYPAVEVVMRLQRVKDHSDCFERLQIMESAALREMR